MDKQKIIDKFLKDVLVVDTESTGLDPQTAEICEIGSVRANDGKNPVAKDKLFGTKFPIPYAASSKNNISRKMIDGLPTVHESMDDVKELLQLHKPVKYFAAHNFKYDKAILESTLIHRYSNDGVTVTTYPQDTYDLLEKLVNTKWICTYRLAKHLFHPTEEDKDLSYALNYLRYAFDLPVEGTVHRAGDDAKVTWYLLQFIAEYVLETQEEFAEDFDLGEYLFELSKSPVPYTVMPFGKHKGENLRNVPDSYFKWMLNNSDILKEGGDNYDPDFALSVETELNRRMGN